MFVSAPDDDYCGGVAEPLVHISGDRIWIVDPMDETARSFGIPWRTVFAFYFVLASAIAVVLYLSTTGPLRALDAGAAIGFSLYAVRLARWADRFDPLSFEWSTEHRCLRVRERDGTWTNLGRGQAAARFDADVEGLEQAATTLMTPAGRQIPIRAQGPGAYDAIQQVHGAVAQLAAGSPTLGIELLRDAVPRMPGPGATLRAVVLESTLSVKLRIAMLALNVLSVPGYLIWRALM